MSEYPKPAPKQKKSPQPLKRTPLKKMSGKQRRNLDKYEKGKVEKYGDRPTVCTGCDRNDVGISCSHLVARSHSFELVSEKANHEMQCFACADLTERGQYFALNNGLALMERLWCGLGDNGRQRFWYIWNQWESNRNLWQMSQYFDSEIHN